MFLCCVKIAGALAAGAPAERVTFAFGGQPSLYAANVGAARSTKHTNRALRALATTDSRASIGTVLQPRVRLLI